MADELRALVAAHDLTAVVAGGRVASVGAGWTARLGADPTGSAAAALVAPSSAEALAAAIVGATVDVEVGGAWLRVFGIVRDDGAVLVATDVSDLRDRERAAQRAEAVLREVGATLARARHRLAEAQALGRVSSFELDPTSHAMTWSPGMYDLIGVPPDADLSDAATFSRHVHPEDLDQVRSWFWSAPADGERREAAFRIVRFDGGVRWVRSALATERAADGRTLICGSVRDVTGEHDAGEMLARARDEAQRAVGEHARFLAELSHDLRTPIAGVIGLIDLAVAAGDPRAAERDLRSASAAARHLLGVIDDLVTYARLESGQIVLEDRALELAEVIAEAVALVSASARAKGVALDAWIAPELPRWRRGDPLRVRQILVKLLGDAVDHAERGGVALAVSAGATPDQIVMRIDGGVGTTGIGLAIARELTARMHGRIEITGAPGAGGHLTLTLALPEGTPQPIAPPPPRRRASASVAPPAPLAPAIPPAARPLRVLIADDTALVRDVVARLLGDVGHDTITVGDGDAAIAAALSEHPDMILMDLSMPGTDGLAATRRIRREARARGLPRVPIIALTAWPDDLTRALDAGMDDYLVKPLDASRLDELCEAVGAGTLLPPIDRAALLERVGGNPQLATDVAALFVAKQGELASGVREAIALADPVAIARTAHGVRGALAMVAASPAATVAGELEAHAADAVARGALYAKLLREIARAVADLALDTP